MNIKAKERGKAILFTGTNYEEVMDTFDLEPILRERFGTEIRSATLAAYTQDARHNVGPVFGRRGELVRVVRNQYAVVTNLGVFVLEQQDFNELFEEDLTI